MKNTTLTVIGSAVVIAFILMLAATGYMMGREPTTPEKVPVEARLVQRLTCETSEVTGAGYRMTIPTAFSVELEVYIKAVSASRVTIDKVIPSGPGLPGLEKLIVLNPGESRIFNAAAPWGNIEKLATLAKPGDMFQVRGGSLTRVFSGTLTEYASGLPANEPPGDYIGPFTGITRYQLDIAGLKISSFIQDPGYAATALWNGTTTVLALAEVRPADYYYEEYDIPFFLDFYSGRHTGFYVYADGEVGIIRGPSTLQPSDTYYLGFWYLAPDGVAELYIGSDTSPAITTTGPATDSWTAIAGVARERPAVSKAKLMLVFWNHFDRRLFNLPGMWKKHETDYLYFVVDIATGDYYVKMWGPGRTRGDFNNPETWGAPPYNPRPCGRIPPYFWIMEKDPPGPSPVSPDGVNHGRDLLDLVIGWDDTQGGCIEEKFRITIFEDGWARIEHLYTWGRPYDEVFIAPVVNYAPGPDWDFNGFPDNWYHIYSLTNRRGDVHWVDLSSHVSWERYPVASEVQFLGLYTSPYITISGLYPGDTVFVYSAARMKTYTVEDTVLDINVLKEFGVMETIATLKNGGFRIIVVPSIEHVVSLLPTTAVVHAVSESHDVWLKVDMPIVLECQQLVEVKSSTPMTLEAETRDGLVWRVEFNGEPIGAYPSLVITLVNGQATVYTDTGARTLSGPLRITLGPPDYIGIADGVRYYTIKNATRVVVTGTEFSALLRAGK